MPVLSSSFILPRIKELTALPVSWFVKRQADQTLYILDLRNCAINNIAEQVVPSFKDLAAEKKSGITKSNRTENILSYPELILKVDFSLNDVKHLAAEDIIVFPELRSLDVSLNAIQSFQGVEVATKLVSLNLSYNNIRLVPNESLSECINLQNLDLSVNKIASLVGFPNLPNLIKLNLRHNKLKDLQGLQTLRSVKQLDASRNKLTTIIHICPCLELTELYLSDNLLNTISDVVSAISPVPRLKQISVKGNPIMAKTSILEVQAMLIRETSVDLVDGINIRPAKAQFKSFSHLQPPSPRDNLKLELKQAARESIAEGAENRRKRANDDINFLQRKILTILEDLEMCEDQAVADTEAWCRYIDTLTLEEARSLTVSHIRAAAIAQADKYLPIKASSLEKPDLHVKVKPTK